MAMAAIALMGSFAACAQAPYYNGIFLHGGVGASTIQNAGVSGFNKLNLFAGIGYHTHLDGHWSMGIEANFSQKGARQLPDGPAIQPNQYTADLLYAQAAAPVNYRIADDFSVFLGPAMGVLISSREENFFGEITGPSKTNYRTIDLSAVAGVRYHIGDHLALAVRLDQSVLPIVNTGLPNNNLRGVRQFNTLALVVACFAF